MNHVSNPASFVGVHRGEDQRHAFVRRIALCQHVAEYHEVPDLRQAGIRLAVVAVELPVHRARCLADDVDIDFAPGGLRRPPGGIAETLGTLLEVVRFTELRAAQSEVVKDVQREDFVAQHVPVLARAVGGPEGQHSDCEDRRTGQPDVQPRRARNVAFEADLPGREPQQRQVHGANEHHGGVDVAQQLARLAGIGRQYVGEHVRGDDRIAEQVQQHDLEGTEEDERKGQPDHHARAAQRHAPHHVESQRHEDQRLDGPQGIGLRIGQHQIGNDQRHEEIDGQQRRETTACLDRPPPDFLVGISFHILRYSLACQKASLILSRNPLVFLPNP